MKLRLPTKLVPVEAFMEGSLLTTSWNTDQFNSMVGGSGLYALPRLLTFLRPYYAFPDLITSSYHIFAILTLLRYAKSSCKPLKMRKL